MRPSALTTPPTGPRLDERVRRVLGGRPAFVGLLSVALAALWLAAAAQGVPAERILSLAVRGVMLGGILALGAIGLSLIFGVLRIPNFAHGDMMTAGAYLALLVATLLPVGAPLGPFSFGYEFLVALLVAMPLVGALGYALDRLVFRRLRAQRSPPVILAMAALGSAFFVRSLIYLAWGADFTNFYTGRPRPAVELFAGIRVRPDQLFILGLALLLIFLVYLLLERTKMGKAMRATADNPDLARVTGIDTEGVIRWTWLVGGALAGAGGVMYGLDAQLRPEMGWWLLLPLFAAVILGTIGNAYGALLGAMIIGIAWQVSSAFLDPAYGPGVAFMVLILVLLFRPQGIFGRPGGT
jgi:branched-chain amino acid transport system permease protein